MGHLLKWGKNRKEVMNCSYFKFSDLFKTELISSTEIQNHLCFLTLFIATNITWIFPGGSEGKESACNVGDPGSIPGSGGSPGENDYPLRYSCLESPVDRGAWQATVLGSQRAGHDRACSQFHILSQKDVHPFFIPQICGVISLCR